MALVYYQSFPVLSVLLERGREGVSGGETDKKGVRAETYQMGRHADMQTGSYIDNAIQACRHTGRQLYRQSHAGMQTYRQAVI